MLATEFLFSGTFSLTTPDKHIKSQQKSTLAKYEKNVSFMPLSFCLLDALFLCKLALSQTSFTTKFHFKWH